MRLLPAAAAAVCCLIISLLPAAHGLITVKAGIIMANNASLPYRYEMAGPAIDLGIVQAEAEYNVRFEKIVNLTQNSCSRTLSTGFVSDLVMHSGVDVLIGPACSGDLEISGEFATYYKIPQVTGAGDNILNKNNYPLLTRLSYSLVKMGEFFKTVLKEFNWQNTGILIDESQITWIAMGSSLEKSLIADPNFARPILKEYHRAKPHDFDKLLDALSVETRVIIMFVHGDDLRKIMMTAHKKGWTTNGEYVFIAVELFSLPVWGDYGWARGDGNDTTAQEAYKALLKISLTPPSGQTYTTFSSAVKARALSDYGFTYGSAAVNQFVGAFYDAVIYLAKSVNESVEASVPITAANGLEIAQQGWNSTFTGFQGKEVFVDGSGDRAADYSLLDTDSSTGAYVTVGLYDGYKKTFTSGDNTKTISEMTNWPMNERPPNKPKCGYTGNDFVCYLPMIYGLVFSFLGIIIVCIGAFFFFRHRQHEQELANMSWKINWDDITFKKGGFESKISMCKSTASLTGQGQVFAHTGSYHGTLCAVRILEGVRVNLNRKVLEELKIMRDVQHDNLVRFVGAVVDHDRTALLTEYCPKGSLQDILSNDGINLDWVFRYSIINDIVRGMRNIHDSALEFHGHFKSSNCVVNSRFVLKITDYGPPMFLKMQEDNKGDEEQDSPQYFRQKFWTPPEVLSGQEEVDQPSDVYAFGIILYELITRNEPYSENDLDPEDVIEQVMEGQNPPLRPSVDPSSCPSDLYKLMNNCWAENPEARPSFDDIHTVLIRINKDNNIGGNILDNLINRLEQYAGNLESVVEERTLAFLDEKKRSEELLYRVIPKSIAAELKQGNTVAPEVYDCITVYFSDIVGFSTLSAASTPMQVVDLLNDLYNCFDSIIQRYEVYKMETIGDAYMVVSGLPIKNGTDHARQIAILSLALRDNLADFKIRHLPEEKLRLRIGIHSGPAVAGVVGLEVPRYCIFGETVITASKMESTGEAFKIHMSEPTKELLDPFKTFSIAERGKMDIKGKGSMTTYWLNSTSEQML